MYRVLADNDPDKDAIRRSLQGFLIYKILLLG